MSHEEGWPFRRKLHDSGPGVARRVTPRAEVARSGATLKIQAPRGSVTPKATAAGSLRFDSSLLHEIDPDLVFEIQLSGRGRFPEVQIRNPADPTAAGGLRFVSGYVSNTTLALNCEISRSGARDGATGGPQSGK